MIESINLDKVERHEPTETEKRLKEDPALLNEELRKLRPDIINYVKHKFCLTSPNPAEDAEDITQDTFLKATRSIANYTGSSSFRTWLHTIAKNAAIDKFRATNKKPFRDGNFTHIPINDALDEDPAAHSKPTIEEKLVTQSTVQKIASSLKGRSKEVFLLSANEGIGPREIAEQLQMKEDSVKMILSRLRQKFRKLFKRD